MNFATIPAMLATAAGIALVYTDWQRPADRRRGALLAGWLLLIASVWLWIRASGVEFGILFALFTTAPLAWACVALQSEQRERRVQRDYVAGPGRPPVRKVARNLALFVAAVPLAAVAAGYSALIGSTWLPAGVVDRMAVGVLATPVLWGLFAWWVCIDSRLWRPVLTLAAVSAGSALLA